MRFGVRGIGIVSVCLWSLLVPMVSMALPLASDSRIKTFVYSENEVFRLMVLYGYQANIEFGLGEEIQTISMGSAYAWQVTPVGRRVFVKPIEPNARTNMTLITSKRTYQFELVSKIEEEAKEEEQVYVVRFYYPDMNFDQPRSPIVPSGLDMTAPRQSVGVAPLSAQGIMHLPEEESHSNRSSPLSASRERKGDGYNYNYTFVGPERIAPEKVFDDGKATYFRFRNNNASIPHVFLVDALKGERRLSYSIKGEYVVVQALSAQFSLKMGKDVVCVFNEISPVVRSNAPDVVRSGR